MNILSVLPPYATNRVQKDIKLKSPITKKRRESCQRLLNQVMLKKQ